MAKEKSLYIGLYGSENTNDDLQEILSGVLENIQTIAVSEALKSRNGSGTPTSGSVEYKRFVNSELKAIGTARTAGAGTKIEAKPIIVNIDDDKEIVEEVTGKDLKLYGIAGVAEKRKANHAKRTAAYLDTLFFAEAVSAGTKVDRGSYTAVQDIIDNMIVTAKATKSDFIDGIDAMDLALVVNGTYRKALKSALDELPNGTTPKNGEIGMYDSLTTYECNRMPAGINAIVMLKEAIAQPYYTSEYDMEKIPLSENFGLELFLHDGTQALVEEAIYYDQEPASV